MLAAHRGHIKAVIIPSENEKDLADIPANVLRELEIVFVENVDDVLQRAFVPEDKPETYPRQTKSAVKGGGVQIHA